MMALTGTAANGILEEWLRSLGLVHYTQAFLDNGYDELEICKQIGDADLDAIGVVNDEHRYTFLDAVRLLRKHGSAAMYFTLEDGRSSREVDDSLLSDIGSFPSPMSTPYKKCPGTGGGTLKKGFKAPENYEEGKTLLIFPKFQLKLILRDKLLEDDVNLASSPYTTKDGVAGQTSLQTLALRYAAELHTHVQDVYDRLEELRWTWTLAHDVQKNAAGPPPMYSPIHSLNTLPFAPPPIPPCPPPSRNYQEKLYSDDLDRCIKDAQHLNRSEIEAVSTCNYVAVDSGMCCILPKVRYATDEKSSSEAGTLKKNPLGRLFKPSSKGRRNRKYQYRQVKGDPSAYEMTMNDEDRMALMLMVKEGKITSDMAVEVVKRFEKEKQYGSAANSPQNHSRTGSTSSSPLSHARTVSSGSENSPTLTRASITHAKKGRSATYSEISYKCEACLRGLPHDYEEPCCKAAITKDGILAGHSHYRRYHSVGHMEYSYLPHSPEVVRALSCSPTTSHIVVNRSNKSNVSSSLSVSNSPAHVITNSSGASRNLTTPVMSYCSPIHNRYNRNSGIGSVPVSNNGYNKINNGCISHVYKANMRHSLSPEPNSRKMMSVPGYLHGQQRPPSRASVMSSESDTSLDCPSSLVAHPQHADLIGLRNGDGFVYSSANSSMSSESSPAIGAGRYSVEKYRSISTVEEMDSTGSAVRSGSSLDSIDSAASTGHVHHLKQQQLSAVTLNMHASSHQASCLGFARALVDFMPPVYDKDLLPLKVGDTLQLLTITQTDLCKGTLCHTGRIGLFRFSQVEMLTDHAGRSSKKERVPKRRTSRKTKPRTVEEMLDRIGLVHLCSVFLLNGFDKLETFADIDEDDLNELNIRDPEQRAKLLTAAELLADYESSEVSDGNNTKSDASGAASPPETPISSSSPSTTVSSTSHSHGLSSSQPTSRDSGCYDSNENLPVKDSVSGRKSGCNSGASQATLLSRVACCRISGANVSNVCAPLGSPGYVNDEICAKHLNNGDTGKTNLSYKANDKVVLAGYSDDSSDLDEPDVDHKMFCAKNKCFSEEDQEVCAITCGYLPNGCDVKTQQSQPKSNTAKSDSTNGYSEDSTLIKKTMVVSKSNNKPPVTRIHTAQPSKTQSSSASVKISTINGKVLSVSSDSSESTSSDLSDTSPHKKPKPAIPVRNSSLNPVEVSHQNGTNNTHHQHYCTKPDSPPTSSQQDKVSSSNKKIHIADKEYLLQNYSLSKPRLDSNQETDKFRSLKTMTTDCLESMSMNDHNNSSHSEAVGKRGKVDAKLLTIQDFLTSIGLSTYIQTLTKNGYMLTSQLVNFREIDLQNLGITERSHLRRVCRALDWYRAKLSSPGTGNDGSVPAVKDRV